MHQTAYIYNCDLKQNICPDLSYKGGNSLEQVKTLGKMLASLDAEKFCSGHSEPIDRAGIREYIDQMQKRQEKVRALKAKGKSLDEIKQEFEAGEARLIESIFNEIKASFGKNP